MEQYRNQIDELLSKLGIDYREINNGPQQNMGAVLAKLAAYSKANPQDPLAQRIAADPRLFAANLQDAQLHLKTGQGNNPLATTYKNLFGSDPTPAAGPEAPQVDPREAQFRDYMTKFINRMNSQLTPDDPMYKQLTQLSQMGASRASQDVGGRGLRVGRGGLGELAIQQGAQNAVAPFEMQRAQMAQQAMGMLNSGNMGWEQMRQGAHSLALQEQGMQNQLNQAQYAQDADRAGGMGGLVGGIGGGVLGGLATLATGGAAAPLIPGLIQGGAAVGGSLGQSGVIRPRFGAVPRYRYGGGGGQGGGYA